MNTKIVSVNRDNLYDIADVLDMLPDIEEGVAKVFWFDAKKNELLIPLNVHERFPEQVFPIKIIKYGKIYYVSPVDELKALPPNQKEQLEILVKELAPADCIINMSV